MITIKRSVLIGVLLSFVVALASYYQQDFFPIGFTGFEHTGYWGGDGSPYPDNLQQYPYGTWAWEDTLLVRTHCNFIGCADGYQAYYLNVNPALPDSSRNDFYNRVCLESDSIYLATKTTFCIRYKDWNNDGDINDTFYTGDTITDDKDELKRIVTASESPFQEKQSTVNYRWSSLWRNYWPHGRYGEGEPDSFWNETADSASLVYYRYFDRTGVSTSKFWGYNPFVEDPSIDVWKQGIPDAGRRITENIRNCEDTGSSGLSGYHRMIIAKTQFYPLIENNADLFGEVPEIDAVLMYGWTPYGDMPYGSQSLFDTLLYGYYDGKGVSHVGSAGFHNAAKYMQRSGNSNLRSEQKRRWMVCLQIHWEFYYDEGTEKVKCRRPCPPEIRAMSYLALSRGAKGLLFYSYLGGRRRSYDSDTVLNVFPTNANMPRIDNDNELVSSTSDVTCLGLRDSTSRPCDSDYRYSNQMARLLNVDTSCVWDGAQDTTFDYLCVLIPEIKLLAPTLMQLDWVNGYSLNSTDPRWASPCPHEYVMDVWGVDYMDLGLFDHPYEPIGVEYFMLVNREGIADMTNRTVTVALDAAHWPQEDSLLLTDIANKEHPKTLVREGDRYVFTQVFEPGEGKLYRVSQINQAPIALSK